MEYSDPICYKWWLMNYVLHLLMPCSYLLHRLTCVVSEVTSVCMRVKGQAGAQLQPHAGEVLMVRQLQVVQYGRSGTQEAIASRTGR
jgi:hypothetical protein